MNKYTGKHKDAYENGLAKGKALKLTHHFSVQERNHASYQSNSYRGLRLRDAYADGFYHGYTGEVLCNING